MVKVIEKSRRDKEGLKIHYNGVLLVDIVSMKITEGMQIWTEPRKFSVWIDVHV